MKPIKNAKQVFLRAWSVRWMALSVVLSGLEVFFQLDGRFAIAAGVTTVIAGAVRFIDQGIKE